MVLSKAGIDSDCATLEKLSTAFYKEDLSHRISATDILKVTRIDTAGTSYSEADLKNSGKQMYHGYSLLTHASNLSQQAPYKQENFYSLLNSCLSEICLLLDVFLIVYLQYLDILYKPFLDERKLSKKEQGYLWAARVNAGDIKYKLPHYRQELEWKQNIYCTFLQISFMLKWHIDKDRLL